MGLFLLMALGGCMVPNKAHYPVHPSVPHSLVVETGSSLKARLTDAERTYLTQPFAVEFDDHGEFWDPPGRPPNARSNRSQFDEARVAIAFAKQRGLKVNLVVYVHGWKHNASDTRNPRNPDAEGNLPKFGEFIRALNDSQVAKDAPSRIFMGVYVGWRGASWPMMRSSDREDLLPPVNDLLFATFTFWNRIAAADRIAGSSLTFALLTLAADAKFKPIGHGVENEDDQPDKVIFIGHSMGGRILEHAVAQAMIGPFAQRAPEIATALTMYAADELRLPGEIENLRKKLESFDHRRPSLEEAVALTEQALAEAQKKLAEKHRAILAEPESAASGTSALIASFRSLLGSKEPAPSNESESATLSDLLNAAELLAAKTTETKEGGDVQRQALLILLQKAQAARDRLVTLQPTPPPSPEDRVRLAQEVEELTQVVIKAKDQLTEAKRQIGLHDEQRRSAAVERRAKKFDLEHIPARRAALLARPADLVLLLNPAVDSIGARQLQSTLASVQETVLANNDLSSELHREITRPWIVAVSSPADKATRFIYRAGSFIGGFAKRFRTDYPQASYYRTPPPQNDELVTHLIEPIPEPTAKPATPTLQSAFNAVAVNSDPKKIRAWLEAHAFQPDAKTLDQAVIADGKPFQLIPKNSSTISGPTGFASTGYWIVRADKSLIQGHGDIFSARAQGLVAALLRIAEQRGSSPNLVTGSAGVVETKLVASP